MSQNRHWSLGWVYRMTTALGASARRCGRMAVAAIAAMATLLSLLGPAGATIQFNDLQLSGNLESQNLIRKPSASQFQFIQNRNVARIRLDWDLMQRGKFADKFDLPFLKESHFFLLYRGVYDGFYDIKPGGNQVGQTPIDDQIGGPISGNRIGSCRNKDGFIVYPCPGDPSQVQGLLPGAYSRMTGDSRSAAKFENALREIYIDATFSDIPLTMRIGRQQVIWGEADMFRLADIWNPLDVTWRFPAADTFDDYRVPLWLMKGIVDLGNVGPLTNTFLEIVYNPFDFQPGQKVAWLPRPGSIPYADPLRGGQVNWGTTSSHDSPDVLGNGYAAVSPIFMMNGTSYQKGDFNRSPADASEIGARFHAVLPGGAETSINYIYGRGKFVGTSPAFGVKIRQIYSDLQINQTRLAEHIGDPSFCTAKNGCMGRFAGLNVGRAWVDAEVVHPYVHVFGITGNYYENEYTSSVLRMETAYALGEPYATTEGSMDVNPSTAPVCFVLDPESPVKQCDPIKGKRDQYAPVGYVTRDVWAGMIGFDRPTWIRALNKKSTFFITNQFFWTNIPGHNVSNLKGIASSSQDPYFTPDDRFGDEWDQLKASGGMGQWETGPFAGQTERTQNGTWWRPNENSPVTEANGSPNDDVSAWELLNTTAISTGYKGGTVMPQFVQVFDPLNLWLSHAYQLQYSFSPSFSVTLQQRFFWSLHPPTRDPWMLGRFGRRDETGVKFTYQF